VIAKEEERIVSLAKQIFAAFPRLVTGLKFHVLPYLTTFLPFR